MTEFCIGLTGIRVSKKIDYELSKSIHSTFRGMCRVLQNEYKAEDFQMVGEAAKTRIPDSPRKAFLKSMVDHVVTKQAEATEDLREKSRIARNAFGGGDGHE